MVDLRYRDLGSRETVYIWVLTVSRFRSWGYEKGK